MFRPAIVVAFTFVLSNAIAGAAQPPTKKSAAPAAAEIAKLIEQLGSDKFAEREAAGRKLAEMDDVPAALEAVIMSGKPETARRAKAIAAQIRERNHDRYIDRLITQINAEGLDLFVDRMVLKPDYATDDRWAAAVGLAQKLAADAGKLGGIGFNATTTDWTKMRVLVKLPPTVVRESRVLIEGLNGSYNGIWNCFVLVGGSVSRLTSIQNSIVFVCGDFEGCTGLTNTLLICTGKVGYITSVQNSIVLAGGTFDGSTSARGSLFDVKGVGRHTSAIDCVYVNLKEVMGARPGDNKFVETEKGPFQALKFFDPASLGVTTTLADGETRAATVTANSTFARAGLRPGDELLSIGGTKWNTKDEFHRLQRRALLNESAKVRVRRGDRVLELVISFADGKGR